jgi:putative membrane protein
MLTPQFKSYLATGLLALSGAVLLAHSLAAYPQGAPSDRYQGGNISPSSPAGTSTMQSNQAGMASSSKLSQMDERLIKQLAESNLAEISAAKLAENRAQSDDVKSFAKKLMDDHNKALADLKQLAQAKNVDLPTEPDKQQRAMEKKLSALQGAKFDQQYLQQAGDRARKQTYRLLERTSARAENPDLKNYASKLIATVETHQQMAKDTSQTLKSSGEGKSGSGIGGSSGDQQR